MSPWGFHRSPDRERLKALLPDLEWGLQASIDTLALVAGFDFPDWHDEYEFVSLQHPDEYPYNHGQVVSSSGLRIDVEDYEEHFAERHMPQSTACTV
ncbi:MAG: hypothetical protein R3C10_20980 [Pirellulales bacterium]